MADVQFEGAGTSGAGGVALEQWRRYEYLKRRGHVAYCRQAARCEEMYLGAGRQWNQSDKDIYDAQKRPTKEFNEILPSVNSAVGYQIHNRMDISFRPAGGKADQELAEIHSKIAMQVSNKNRLQWLETQVFTDGLVEQRGFFDVRMDYSDSVEGTIKLVTLDPMDVIPDADAKSYDPDEWGDVTILRWMTLDELEQLYGKEKRDEIERTPYDDPDFGTHDDYGVRRNKFGNDNMTDQFAWDSVFTDSTGLRRVRVLDRQKFIYSVANVAVFADGSIRKTDGLGPEKLAEIQQEGGHLTKRMAKQVRWTVSTSAVVLHDDWSPYDHFTIVPYFAYFRRGVTLGMVDNAIDPQETYNKAVSQFVHIVNSAANSGWIIEEASLTNMETADLEERGAMTGLVIEHKKDSKEPVKIQPNQVPTGVDKLIERAALALKNVTVPEAMRGIQGQEVSGVAIQSKQFASQQQLAIPLDNLARTRNLVADRIHNLVQRFYTNERIFRITEQDPITGKDIDTSLHVNRFDQETGGILNDLTVGEYDVVISDQPMQITFDNSQFTQAMELKKEGVNIPDTFVLKHSNLSDKYDIIEAMGNQTAPTDPTLQAKADLMAAQTALAQANASKIQADTVLSRVTAMYEAMQAAGVIAATPATAGLGDKLLHSAGMIDQDAPPIVPEEPVQGAAQALATPGNTHPNLPMPPPPAPSAGTGAEAGIETPRIDGVAT